MRRLVSTLLALAFLMAAPAAFAQQDELGVARVIKVEGVFDRILSDFIIDSVRAADADQVEVLAIQLDSGSSVISDLEQTKLALMLSHADVPVAVWVGESGAEAVGDGAVAVVRSADLVGVAPGVELDPRIDVETFDAPVLSAFVAELDGRQAGGRKLETAKPGEDDDDGNPTREPTVVTTFSQPSLVAQLLHGVSSPSVAYLLLMVGLLLIVFEFFTAGVGIAAATGILCLGLAAFGLGALPTRPIGLALIGLAILGFSIDTQAGAPRVWTGVGTLALVAGSLVLFDGITIPLVTMVLVIASTLVFVISGLPSVVRARFSTPTIGREAMIGEMGTALADVTPDGTVEIRGAAWRARTNRATPIKAGEPVRVVAIEGIVLEVEPEEGGAKDAGH
jgi:membrane-bound serine protease (ClpP class)